MSAASIEVVAFEPARRPTRTAYTPLRLVASDGTLSPDRRFASGELVLVPVLPALRFTRRGRLVLTLMAIVAAATLALALASTVDAADPQIDHATTVSAGQTLSEVAATQLPRLPIRDAVARIQLVNGLNTSQVHAGQSLLIPVVH